MHNYSSFKSAGMAPRNAQYTQPYAQPFPRPFEKLIYVWQKSGLSQEAIADKLGVSFVTVNRWIHFRMQPRYRNRLKITTLYNECIVTNLRAVIEQKIYFLL